MTQGQDGQTILLFSEKGAWSRLGVYLVHLSVLIIFLGAIIGNLFGFSGHLNLNQGGASDEIVLDNGEPHRLGFGLRLDKFTVSFYKDGMPSEYRSEVTFLDQDKEAMRASLVVNDPAEFKGVDFYQSSYGQSPVSMTANLVRGEQTEKVTLKHGEWVDLPGGGQALLLEAREDVHMGDMYHGPAARIGYQGPGVTQPVGITAFKAGTSMPARGPVKFEILDMELVPYSGFSVKYDPGVWFIWLGCTLMVLGFLVTFYASHQKAWLRLIPLDKGRTRLELAGSANKNRFGLRRKIERLAGQLRADAPQGD